MTVYKEMYQYSLTQWVFFFYFYCFFGWCFESSYVSIRMKKWTNRGFMRGPFLPLYGSGAIMMLVVSMPFQDSIPLTYLAGCVGATLLEYVTGVIMEALFKVRYWDYSHEKFNFQGHICLKSTLAWGGLTILMTGVVHRYVEYVVFLIPSGVLTATTFVLTACIFADFSLSFKAALDLRDILIKLENAKIELGHLQMRMDILIALTTEEWEQKVAEYKGMVAQRKEALSGMLEERRDDLLQGIAEWMNEVGNTAENMEPERIRERIREKISYGRRELQRHRADLIGGMERRLKAIFQANPSMHSKLHGEALQELRDYVIAMDQKKNE